LSKYKVLKYLAEFKSDIFENLAKSIRKNIFFEKVSDWYVLDKLNILKKERFVIGFEINSGNKKTIDCLVFYSMFAVYQNAIAPNDRRE